MTTQKDADTFPNFTYKVSEIRKYIQAGDIFTMMLNNGTIIHHITHDQKAFNKWLNEHEIIDIRKTG